MKRYLCCVILAVLTCVYGCRKKEETPTSGERLLLAADPYLPLMQQEIEQFMSIYPGVKMTVRGASTREAIVLMLNDSVQSIVVDRQFNEEEQQIIKQASLKIVENKIAEDGIAIIVHRQNPIANISIESARKIAAGEAKKWNQVPESGRPGYIELVLTDKNSGMYELLQKKIFSISEDLKPAVVMPDQDEVIKFVSANPKSIGFVASSLANADKGQVKIVPVLVKSQDGIEKSYMPQQEEIYNRLYPFHFSLYLYNAESKASVGIGFSAQVLSNIGQKIIQNAGLVPASIPYRIIQLNAE
jgi:phosphate transport system substrate-binding protein